MDDLVEFLRARLDEDEREIRLVLQPDEPSPQLLTSHRAMHMVLTHQLEAAWPTGSHRMFEDIASKRRILDEVVDEATSLDMSVDLDRRVGPRDDASEPYLGETLLRLLARPYAEHPDYREEWRP